MMRWNTISGISRLGLARRLSPDESGATLVEMAVVLPVFFLMLFGFFSFALVLFGFCNATLACRIGARYASLHSGTSLQPCTSSSTQGVVTSYLIAAPSGGTTITTTWMNTNTIGDTVKVDVMLVYPVSIPFSNLGPLSVGSSAQRKITR